MALSPGSSLTAAKVVLLAVHLASHADITSLSTLAARESGVLRPELLLRILLTFLPETTPSNVYTGILEQLRDGSLQNEASGEIDLSLVQSLSDEEATRKIKKLRLLQLSQDKGEHGQIDLITRFLFSRAYRVDEEAGLLGQLPDLVLPFVNDLSTVRTWLVSTIVPLMRRNFDYYPQQRKPYTLSTFESLPDPSAVEYLLAQTGARDEELGLVGRDLDGLITPWLYDDSRWRQQKDGQGDQLGYSKSQSLARVCSPGWDEVLQWLLAQASKSWRISAAVVEQWDGPKGIEVIPGISITFQESQQTYLSESYIRAAIAVAYLTPDSTLDALEGANRIAVRVLMMLGQSLPPQPFHETVSALSTPQLPAELLRIGPKLATHMRNDLLRADNPLTSPDASSVHLLLALISSAFLSTRLGVDCTIRQAGDLVFLGDEREQKAAVTKLIRAVAARSQNQDDSYWAQSRLELLWLRDWGLPPDQASSSDTYGLFGCVSLEFIETEFLKTLLANSRYALAQTLYDGNYEKPLQEQIVHEVVYNAALNAYDNASNPHRHRGGLKKCDEIMKALPNTMSSAPDMRKRIEALLKATHALSDYRLVLKQGEPFNPVVLRVHSDPIVIIAKVLEQNPRAYTRLQEFLETGANMAKAGLITPKTVPGATAATSELNDILSVVEKRIVAMCIEAALNEDDFETAYSYVVSRLDSSTPESDDQWSWSAALKAGQYIRTQNSLQPTHLGTASGNPEIRHLEQRIECLATALRVAPPNQLQDILKTFRRCEEQLDSAIQEEAAREAAWDDAGDSGGIPGAFNPPEDNRINPSRNFSSGAAARQADEAPMSLFDLSRATARVASRNFTALSSLQIMGQDKSASPEAKREDNRDEQRVRKRDQFREAATGTLVSGVGWLIGANPNRS